MFYKKNFLENFAIFTGKRLCSFFNKNAGLQLYRKETPAQVFSYEFCQIFKNTFIEEHLSTVASESFSFYVSLNVFLHDQIT